MIVEDGLVIPFHFTPSHAPDTFVCIYPPAPGDWTDKYGWAVSEKEEITTLVVDYLRGILPPSVVQVLSDIRILLKKAATDGEAGEGAVVG